MGRRRATPPATRSSLAVSLARLRLRRPMRFGVGAGAGGARKLAQRERARERERAWRRCVASHSVAPSGTKLLVLQMSYHRGAHNRGGGR